MLTTVEVEILGQKFPVRYDVNALGELEDLTGQNTLDGSMKFNMKSLHALAYVGLKHGHSYQQNNKSEFSKSLEAVGTWLPIACLKLFPPILFQFTNGDQEAQIKEKDKVQPGE